MGLKELFKKWNGFNRRLVNETINSPKPLVTVVMLSWKRDEKLIQTLLHLKRTVRTPLNICLRVQQMTEPRRQQPVLELLKKFNDYDVKFTEKNEGTGLPRWERAHKALDKWDTPYILFTDDDMRMPKFSIESLVSILRDKPEFGAVNMHTAPRSNVWGIDEKNRLYHHKPKSIFDDKTVSLGSATLLVRREVFDTCDLDKEYYIGCADIDFGLQMTKAGWKLGMLAIPKYMATNHKGGNTEYGKTRYNKKILKKSKERFRKKWKQSI